MSKCPHCGLIHETTCPRIRSIEYHPDGVTVKRVTFHEPQPLLVGPSQGPVYRGRERPPIEAVPFNAPTGSEAP